MRFTGISATVRLCAVMATVLFLVGCMKSPEQQYQSYMDSGAEYIEAGDTGAAALQFRNAARVQPQNAEPHFQLAKIYLQEGKLQECFGAVREAVVLDPDHVDASLLMAQILARLGNETDVREAEGMLNDVLGARPEDAEALFALAVTRARLGSPEDAENFLQQVLATSPDHLRSAVALARLRMSQNDLPAAEQLLRTAVEKSEDDGPAKIALAQFFLSTGRNDDAVKEIESILAKDPDYGPALLARGLMHLRNGEKDAAEAVYKRASTQPGDIYKTAYGRVLSVNGKVAEATAEFQRLYDEDTSNRQMRTLVVVSKLREGKVDEAENILSEAIERNPRDVDARLQRSEMYLRSGRTELARTDIDSVLEVQNTSPQAHYLLAKIHEATQNPIGARQELGEALRLDSSFLLARLDMAQSLLRSVSKRSALDTLDEAPGDQKQHPRILSGRIWALIALGEYDEAMTSIANVRASIGELADLRLQEGVVHAAKQNFAQAEPLLAKALEANPADLRAFNALVATQFGAKQNARALATVRKQADSQRDNGPLQLSAASWFLRNEDAATARTFLDRAAAIGASSAQADLLLARLDMQDGKDQQAATRLKSIIAKQSRHVEALTTLAMLQEKLGQYADAEKNYRAVLAITPDSVSVLNNLAYLVATRNGNLDEALRFAQQAREYSVAGTPMTGMVEDTLGWVHYLRGNYDVAALNLNAAAEKAPTEAVIRYHLAMAQAKAGNASAAKASYQAGLALNADLPEARTAAELVR